MDLREFHHLEADEIRKHRWIESERAGKDLSDAAEEDWVQKYAAQFRKQIEEKHGPIKIR